MDRIQFKEKYQEDLETALYRQEFEVKFLEDELGKLEDDINKTSQIIYPTAKEGKKDIGHLQQEKQALTMLVEKQNNLYETMKAKYEFLIEGF